MINTNEIRLGNYYQDRGGKWLRVDFIEYIEKGFSTKFGQKMFLENQEVHPMTEYSDYANPIELTKDWLVKFGFKPFSKDFQKNAVIIHTRKRGFVVNTKIPVIKYVHQLQNLYYALRGEELS